jgi:hypothetical protein
MSETTAACLPKTVKECLVVGNVKVCAESKPSGVDVDVRSFILSVTGSDFLAYGGMILK